MWSFSSARENCYSFEYAGTLVTAVSCRTVLHPSSAASLSQHPFSPHCFNRGFMLAYRDWLDIRGQIYGRQEDSVRFVIIFLYVRRQWKN